MVAKLSPCVSWLDCWSVSFFGSYRRLICSSLQVFARMCCFLQFCIKPMRYIYHPQLYCYLVAVNSNCSHTCELTLWVDTKLISPNHLFVTHTSNELALTCTRETCHSSNSVDICIPLYCIHSEHYSEGLLSHTNMSAPDCTAKLGSHCNMQTAQNCSSLIGIELTMH